MSHDSHAVQKLDDSERLSIRHTHVQDVVANTANATEDELRRRKLAAETVLAEIQTAKAKGEVGSIEEFERQVTNAAIEIRTRLQQMAGRVAPMVVGLKLAEIKRILRDEVDQALTVLAEDLGSRGPKRT